MAEDDIFPDSESTDDDTKPAEGTVTNPEDTDDTKKTEETTVDSGSTDVPPPEADCRLRALSYGLFYGVSKVMKLKIKNSQVFCEPTSYIFYSLQNTYTEAVSCCNKKGMNIVRLQNVIQWENIRDAILVESFGNFYQNPSHILLISSYQTFCKFFQSTIPSDQPQDSMLIRTLKTLMDSTQEI